MNRSLFIFFGLLLLRLTAVAQPSFVQPYRITVSSNKTTHLIFPSPIKSIDRGSPDILAQKSPGTDAVLQLKADHPRIALTNLTVITANNRLYSFLVVYDSMPQHLTVSFDSSAGAYTNIIPIDNGLGALNPIADPISAVMKETAGKVERRKKNWLHLSASHDRMRLRLQGIYTKEDTYYFLFRLRNRSNVSYATESITFTIRDAKRVRRTASQEKPLSLLYQKGTETPVAGPGRSTWVIATSKFTLEDRKHLQIELLEEEGGRNLSLEIDNRQLLSVRKL